MIFKETAEFVKDFRALQKKYLSLPKDLIDFKTIVSTVPLGNGKHFNVITSTGTIKIIKARFFCRYLRGNSLRVIYAYHSNPNLIDFLEIYFKGNQENEDRQRIAKYLKQYCPK